MNHVLRAAALFLIPLAAFAKETPESKKLRDQMSRLADETRVSVKAGTEEAACVRSGQPVFRYSDAPRRIADATLWVWTRNGRPVALEKIEAFTRQGPEWTFCLTSLTADPLVVRWPDEREFATTEKGVSFTTIEEGPAPAESQAGRERQLKELARRFSARITIDPRKNVTEELRPLPRPVFQYAHKESGLLAGAIFAFAASGTNPDAWLLLELVQPEKGALEWRFAWARMTTGGLQARLDDSPVWEAPFVPPHPRAFETWTFFFKPREP